jgi:LPS export ABC transporter protein LptC
MALPESLQSSSCEPETTGRTEPMTQPSGPAPPVTGTTTTTPVTTNTRLIWLSLLAATVISGVLWLDPFQNPLEEPTVRTAADGPDLELEEALISQFRESGSLKYQLASPLIQHFEGQAHTELTNPDLTLHSDSEPPWNLSALRGSIRNRTAQDGNLEEEVYLENQVVMSQRYPDGRSFQLDTPDLSLYPDRKYAETSRDVTISTHAGRTTAVGLNGDLDKGLLHLFSDEDQRVHTILLPDQFK